MLTGRGVGLREPGVSRGASAMWIRDRVPHVTNERNLRRWPYAVGEFSESLPGPAAAAFPGYVHADIPLIIKAGDVVVLHTVGVVGRDPDVCPDSDRFTVAGDSRARISHSRTDPTTESEPASPESSYTSCPRRSSPASPGCGWLFPQPSCLAQEPAQRRHRFAVVT